MLTFHNCEGQSHKTVSTNHNLVEEKGIEPRPFCLINALQLGRTGSQESVNDCSLQLYTVRFENPPKGGVSYLKHPTSLNGSVSRFGLAVRR